jgi:hypothetical protein
MTALTNIPDWIGEAVLAAVSAVLGFLAKEIWSALKARRDRKTAQVSALQDLRRLLEDSRSVFRSQNYLARRLLTRLRAKHPSVAVPGLGFDETFYRLFAEMDEEERELQALIRSTTLHSMRTLNEALQAWLQTHKTFRTPSQSTQAQVRLSEELQELELHLNQWFDKYKAVTPNEQRSLVYLADEKKQGVAFPKGLKPTVDAVLAELS